MIVVNDGWFNGIRVDVQTAPLPAQDALAAANNGQVRLFYSKSGDGMGLNHLLSTTKWTIDVPPHPQSCGHAFRQPQLTAPASCILRQAETKEEVKPKAPPDGGATGGVVIVAALLPLKLTAAAGGAWAIEWDYTKVPDSRPAPASLLASARADTARRR